jgi:hypothetical protein
MKLTWELRWYCYFGFETSYSLLLTFEERLELNTKLRRTLIVEFYYIIKHNLSIFRCLSGMFVFYEFILLSAEEIPSLFSGNVCV